MKKDADNTPKFGPGIRVKVAGKDGTTEDTMHDGRVVVQFDKGEKQPIEPDKIER